MDTSFVYKKSKIDWDKGMIEVDALTHANLLSNLMREKLLELKIIPVENDNYKTSIFIYRIKNTDEIMFLTTTNNCKKEKCADKDICRTRYWVRIFHYPQCDSRSVMHRRIENVHSKNVLHDWGDVCNGFYEKYEGMSMQDLLLKDKEFYDELMGQSIRNFEDSLIWETKLK